MKKGVGLATTPDGPDADDGGDGKDDEPPELDTMFSNPNKKKVGEEPPDDDEGVDWAVDENDNLDGINIIRF